MSPPATECYLSARECAALGLLLEDVLSLILRVSRWLEEREDYERMEVAYRELGVSCLGTFII